MSLPEGVYTVARNYVLLHYNAVEPVVVDCTYAVASEELQHCYDRYVERLGYGLGFNAKDKQVKVDVYRLMENSEPNSSEEVQRLKPDK